MRTPLALLLAVALTGCTRDDTDTDTGAVDDTGTPTDADGDGFPASEDCDDNDATLNPDTIWYADADGDGFGSSTEVATQCEAPGNASVAPTDCDDTNADINPSAAELCNGVDNDCSGSVDFDADGDGYSGASCGGDDCDDTSDAVNPGVPEDCNDLDNDCSGTVDFDSDGDGYADAGCGGSDCNDADIDISPSASEVCNDLDNDCSGAVDFDADADGYSDETCGGSDCDDADASKQVCTTRVAVVIGYGSPDIQSALADLGYDAEEVEPVDVCSPGSSLETYDIVAFPFNAPCTDAGPITAANEAGELGIVLHRGGDLVNTFDMGQEGFWQEGTFEVTNTNHFITEVYSTGPLPLDFKYKTRLTNPGPNTTVLGQITDPSLVVHNDYRRVVTPYYGHTEGMPWNDTAADLTERSYRWAAGEGDQ